MATKISNEILNQQLEQLPQKAPKKGVELSKATGIDYNSELQKMVKEVHKDINTFILPLVRQLQPEYTADGWSDTIIAAFKRLINKWSSPEFKIIADKISQKFVNQANSVNRTRYNKNMKGFGIDVYGDNPQLTDILNASIQDNVQLIESLPTEYLKNVQSIVFSNMTAGTRSSAIASELTTQFGVSSRRAKAIARDQTAKVNGDMNKSRQSASGFNYFKWLTSDDERVRDRHEVISEKVTAYGKGVYRWDNPPLDEKGVPIIPGIPINCRCTGLAMADWEVKELQEAGAVRPGVYK